MIKPRNVVSETDVAQHYDELDPFYLDVWGEHVHHGLWVSGRESAQTAVRQLVDLVAVAAEIEPDHELCDIGAGYGATARQLAYDYGAKVTALTISPQQYEYARRKATPNENPTYVLADWLHNRLPSESFDAACAIECASHMCDPRRFVDEVARVLRPGGRFVMCAWVASAEAGDRHIRYLLEPICREGRLAHLSTAREYVDLLESAGLNVANFRDLSSKVRRTWSLALRRTLLRVASHPSYLRYLLHSGSRHRIFLVTMLRMLVAYRAGAIRYCLFKCYKTGRGSVTANLT